MELKEDIPGMLDLISTPGFCVKEDIITYVNQAAKALLIAEGTVVQKLFFTGHEEYASYRGGCLYLGLQLFGCVRGASVNRFGDTDVFLLDQDSDRAELTVLALAAKELREPMAAVMYAAQRLCAANPGKESERLNQGLHQILRILGNMSDAASYSRTSRPETVDICAVFEEIFLKAQTILERAGVRLRYQGPAESIYCLADTAQLERAVLNILSNAVKFSSQEPEIYAAFTRRGRGLQLTIRDNGCGIADELLPTVFARYLRQPTVEERRQGLGLGMVLIRSAAVNHGGAVLIRRPETGGTSITLTIAIRQNASAVLRSPAFRVDYSGGIDHILMELADSLPVNLFAPDA